MNVFEVYSQPGTTDARFAKMVQPSVVGGYWNILLGKISNNPTKVELGHKMLAAHEQDKGAKHTAKYYRNLRKGNLKKSVQSQHKATGYYNKSAKQLSFNEHEQEHTNAPEVIPSQVEPPSPSPSTVPPSILPPDVSPIPPPTVPPPSTAEIVEESEIEHNIQVKQQKALKKKNKKQARFAGVAAN